MVQRTADASDDDIVADYERSVLPFDAMMLNFAAADRPFIVIARLSQHDSGLKHTMIARQLLDKGPP